MLFIGFGVTLTAQDTSPENWFNLDPKTDNVPGVSTEKMYQELLGGRESETVIVAVIDSGVDPDHEDLKDVMWVNEDEIPGNGIDDDNNGYIDDIHGWNFIGGKDGKNINHESLEITRLVAKYQKIYDGVDANSLSKKQRVEYDAYQTMKEEIEEKKNSVMGQAAGVMQFAEGIKMLTEHFGKSPSLAELKALDGDETLKTVGQQVAGILEGQGVTFDELKENIEGAKSYFDGQLNYYYNVDFDPRAEVVGDNYDDPYERDYGNNDIQGPDAGHGTHVAGIIAAARGNDVGIMGVADNVRIMSVRAVPDGDERDKDVANAIIYAVDNGASIINMSFGKSYVWNKKVVDQAVKYAMKNDVLLVHAAGNDGKNTDVANNFPHDAFAKRGLFGPKMASNWIEVGALTYRGGADAPAGFSNYGKDNVDVFAPGYQILSTTPDQGYDKYSGTSMAAPVTAGVAAVLRSYFPELTAEQVKEIIEGSIIPQTQKVKQPGSGDLVPFSDLCKTGGVVNSYQAVQKAKKTKGKKKIKKKKKAKVAVP